MSAYSATLTPRVDVLKLREEKWRHDPDWSCYWSDPSNERGLRLTPTITGGKIFVDMVVERHHTGFPRVAFGGIPFSILDGLMGWYIVAYYGRVGFTVSQTVQFSAPLRRGRSYRFEVDAETPPASDRVHLVGTVRESKGESSGRPLVRVAGTFVLPALGAAERMCEGAISEDMKFLFETAQ